MVSWTMATLLVDVYEIYFEVVCKFEGPKISALSGGQSVTMSTFNLKSAKDFPLV